MANPTIQQIQLGNTTYDIRPASAYQDTDTKVKSNSLTSGERPLLLSSATTPTTAAGEVYQNANLKYNAGTGVITVPGVTGAYINSHPENSPCLIPFIYNDIAFLENQGGSVSMYKVASTADMTLLTLPNQTVYKPSDYVNMFDASPSYAHFSGFTKDDTATSYIIDITLPRVFTYSNVVYIDFGQSSWRAQNIKILVSHTNMTNYVQKASITGLAIGNYKASMSHSFTASGATTVTQGFNKIRFVLTKFANASPRIAQIGIINYGSNGTRYTTMSRGIDDPVWRSITPSTNKAYSLGSSSKLWNGVYGNTLYAGASIMPTANSAVTLGSSSVLFKDAYFYQVHVNTAVTTQVQIGTGNIKAADAANQAATKYWATNGTIQSVPTVPTALRNPSALTIQFNGVKKVDYTGASTATVNIPTLDTVTATVTTAASSATAAVKVSTTVSTAGAKTATFAFTLPKGADGTNGTGVGTVTATVATAASSASPTVTVSQVTSGTNKNCTFAFTLPKGQNGTNGSGVGTVTATVASVASNVAPTVTVTTAASGTNKNVTMAFKLPKGDTGATGPSGVVSVVTAGPGNAVTSGSYNSSTKTITLIKGSSFLESNGTAVCASKLVGTVEEIGLNGKASSSSTANDVYDPNLLNKNRIQLQHNSNSMTKWVHMPSGTMCGHILNIGCAAGSMGAQFAWDLGDGTTFASGKLFWRIFDPSKTIITDSSKNYNWLQIATTTDLNKYLPLTGGTCTGAITAPAFYETSDARKKDIIGNLDLDKCISLMDYCNQVVYKLKGDDKEQIGMIAQEVEKWFPEIVMTNEDGYKSLDYSRLTVICLRLIKDLYDKVSSLNSYINECE